MHERINKLVKRKIKNIKDSDMTFKSLFDIIHDQNKEIFSEMTDGYLIETITYQQCRKKCHLMAANIINKLSLPKGEYIGLMMENSPNWIYVFWGLLMTGYKPMLFNVRLPAILNNKIVSILNIKTIIADRPYQVNSSFLLLDELNEKIEINEEDFVWANELALSTSATSMNVKVCIYDGEAICQQVIHSQNIIRQNNQTKKHYHGNLKLLAFLPFYHIFGLMATYFWFSVFGRTFVFLRNYSSETILKTVRKHQVTHLFAVPLLWHGIYKEITKQVNLLKQKEQIKFQKALKLSLKLQNLWPSFGLFIAGKIFKEVQNKVFGQSIKFMITGGSYISNSALELINGIGYPLFNGYGMSEIGITSVELRRKVKYRLSGSIGRPLTNVQYRVNEDSCLLVLSKSRASKIISEDEKVNNDLQTWYNTNDVVNVIKHDYYIQGRRDDVIISSNGEKINPDIIEKELFFSDLKRYAVIGLKEAQGIVLSLILEIEKYTNPLKRKRIVEELENNLERLEKQNIKIEKIYLSYQPLGSEAAIKVSRQVLEHSIRTGKIQLIPYNEFSNYNLENDELKNEIMDVIKATMANIMNENLPMIKDNDHFIFDLGGTSLDYLTLLVKLKDIFEMDFLQATNTCYNAKQFCDYIMKIKKNRGEKE